MATKKSTARGAGSRPAKATAAIGKSRPKSKKPLKVAAEVASPEVEAPETNVVPLTPVETGAEVALPAAEPAPPVEAAVRETEIPMEIPMEIDEPAATEQVVEPETAEEAFEAEPVVAEVAAEEPEVEMASRPGGFSGAAPFPGFPGFPGLPEFPAFGAVDMNAFVASGTALAEGMQALGQELMAYSQHAAERNVATATAMLGASSIEEVIDLQSRHAMGSVDEMLSEGAKLTGMAVEVANRAASPFTRR